MNMPLPPGFVERSRRVLHSRRALVQMIMPGYVARSLDLEIVESALYDELLYRLKSFVLAEDLGLREYEVRFSYPSSWWQHFKRDVLKRRCKVTIETKTVIGHGWRGYPNAPIAIPEDKMGKSVVFEEFNLSPGGSLETFPPLD